MSTSAPTSHHGADRPDLRDGADRPDLRDGAAPDADIHTDADRRPRRASAGGSVARIAVMAALMAVLGLVPPIAVAGVPAPIVLQNIAVILAGLILGPWRGAASMALFAALVALGLPLLTGGRGGLGVFAGPSVGFILGWIPAAMIVGLIFWALTRRARPGLSVGRIAAAAAIAGLIGGVIMVYVFGALGFVGVQGMDFRAAMLAMAVYVPGDLTKLVLAVLLTAGLWKAYPRAFR